MAEDLLTVTIPASQIDFISSLLGKASVASAIYQAVKRTTAAGKKQIRDEIEKDVNLQRKYIDRAITSGVDVSEKDGQSTGTIRVSSSSIPMSGFSPVAGDHGVTVVMTRSHGPLVLKHAFMARVRSNGGSHLAVITRKAAAEAWGGRVAGTTLKSRSVTKRGYYGRLPVQEEKGPNLVSIIGRDKLSATGERVMAGLQLTLKANLQSQLDRFLNQKKGEGIQLPG